MASEIEIKKIYGKKPIKKLISGKYDGIIIAVAHKYLKKMGIEKIIRLGKKNHLIFDLKSIFSKNYNSF